MSIQEILDELEISKDDIYKALLVSKDDDWKENPILALLIIILMFAWKLSRQILTFNLFLASIKRWHICVNIFSKIEGQCSQAIEQALKEAYENNMHPHHTMETIGKYYLNSRECSVEEAFYCVLPELKIRRIFLVVCFVNTNLPEERVQLLFSEKELR